MSLYVICSDVVFFFATQLEGQVVAVLVNNLDRLEENVKEEFEGVHNSLGMFGTKLGSFCRFLFLFFVFLKDGSDAFFFLLAFELQSPNELQFFII